MSEPTKHQKPKKVIDSKSNFLRRTLNSDRVEADTFTSESLSQTCKHF